MRKSKMLVTAGLLVTCSVWAATLQSCCQQRTCENLRTLSAAIARDYAQCCQATDTQACLTATRAKEGEMHSLILQAQIACQNSDDTLLRDTIKKIRDLYATSIILNPEGKVENSLVSLGHNDWIALDITLPRLVNACVPVTSAIGATGIINAEATGTAAESTVVGVETQTAVVVPASSTFALSSCQYEIPQGATLDLRYGTEYHDIGLSGSMSIAQTGVAIPAGGTADVGLPTKVSLKAKYLGQELTFELDKTCPFNTLRVNANGDGYLGVALKSDTNSSELLGIIQVGATLYFTFPVHVSADFSTLRIHATAAVHGDEITPTNRDVLLGADTPPHPVITSNPCADADGNGIRDGADEAINAMLQVSGCSTQH